ncbi:DUF1501 domain-containing protein [Actimicrobium sp. CCI2.3]|uniref:DUF1501 domain-containing protein n=1 Tax=Actimicrobium sp. CCI2.3 TaxID=3048616 RepID=UPI002AB5AD24|nr:DUF1501 domain-containing protein [Actimicrobium sp. CCI2.3]MDY7574976.1 DUF1501 domain-containing protein [Actimicrobium sp. CCI2.3]MEB0021453.1 DUF1501 domain-containing protein [Actimicrobium sp. CCI2.3]
MTTKPNPSRREFLRAASLLSIVGSAGAPFAFNLATIGAAAAQAAPSDYKALICLFMAGGNDHGNTVLATDPQSWAEYQRIRTTSDAGSIALPAAGDAGGVLPITPNTVQPGRNFALHPSLQPLKELFDAKRVAIIANVGTLITPTTLAQYKAKSVKLPPRLFSHNDQQSLWQSSMPEGARSGWGGRMGDLMMAANAMPVFTAISVTGNNVFLAGRTIIQYQVSSAGAAPIGSLTGPLFGSSAGANPLQAIISGERTNLFEKDYATVVKRGIDAQGTFGSAFAVPGVVPDPTRYTNPNTGLPATNPLAVQLQTIARTIAGRNALGAKRQVFFVSMGGFDTHDGQRKTQADLMARLAHAMAYFDGVMGNLQGVNLRNQVTLFTGSDFGRTFSSNGDGTDHGWGAHHFVMGGAVNGMDIYGTFPVTGFKHDLDVGSGSLLPQISVDQYGATLASWFGLSATQIADVFPAIGNFSIKNLGFMG